MKQLLVSAAASVMVIALYALYGDAAFSLVTGLFIGSMAALYFFGFIEFNSAVVIGVVVVVLYLILGDDAYYLFSFLFGVFFCLIGFYALSGIFRKVGRRRSEQLLLAVAAPVALLIGSYLVWTGASELGLLGMVGLEEASASNYVNTPFSTLSDTE